MLLLHCCIPETNYIHFVNKYETKPLRFALYTMVLADIHYTAILVL